MISLRKSVLLTGLVMATAATSVVSLPAQAQEFNSGNLIGGIAGALIGSNVGGGNGRLAATAAGGIIGAVVGGNVERNNNAYYQGYAPQQGYASSYPQQAPQYQQGYGTASYAAPVYEQPVYAQPTYVQPAYGYAPVYTQPSYAYVEPQATIVYSQSYYRGNGGYYGHEYREHHGNERRGHDRHDR
jgi:hypothetical protein